MQSSVSQLIVPERLRPGDTVALISLSGGRAGDPDLLPRYQEGKRRLEKLFGLRTVETPHALKGSAFLYDHPELRAADLMWALENPEVRGVFCIMGGDDSYRVLPYVDLKVIRQEVHREDLVILENVDFVHRTPMTVLPMGALCEIDCDSARLSILEPGVRWGPTILPIKEPAHGTH